jgi:manganese-dependent inorganic pyrophosphatase
MLSAILSDTVGLKSSTTTETDRTAVSDLSVISGITDIDALTLEIFKSKSNIGSLTDEQVITNDYKIFEFGGKKVFISQIETVEQESLISSRKQNLLPALEKTKQNEAVDYIFLAITDILAVNTKLVLSSSAESDLATISFGGIVTDNILDIGPRMSRKKDIAPFIEKALQN